MTTQDVLTGTIIKGVGGQYTVDTAHGQHICNARGLFRKKKITPIVGDKVEIENSTLMTILPRTNELKRPKVSNVDQVLIVLSASAPDLHFTMLDRYLMQAEYENISAAICINKTDLDKDIPNQVKEIYEPIPYQVFLVSINDNTGLEALDGYLLKKTTVLAGPSGVGKSSLINRLAKSNLQTGAVSNKIGRGKHTTRHTEFIPLTKPLTGCSTQPAGYVIDTPGFSSLDAPNIPKIERAALFKEFTPYLGMCKFRDCLHISEAGCVVKEHVGDTITTMRYNRYLEWICD